MRTRQHWWWRLLAGAALAVAVLGWLARPGVATQVIGSPASRDLGQVWQRAKEAGSYHFSADIVQTNTPLATIDNVGRQSKQDRLHVEGQTSLRDRKLDMTLWSQGGSVVDATSGVQVRVEGDHAEVRQGDQPWQPVGDFTGLFAPESDFMTYLVAARDVADHGPDSRGGLSFSRYGFTIDGPAYAAYVRDQMQHQMELKGDLPPGGRLELPRQYAEMTGSGELWVSLDGLPLRQMLHLQLPGQDKEQITAEVTVDFSEFGSFSPQLAAEAPAPLQGKLLGDLLVFLGALAAARMLVLYSRSRKAYAAIVLIVIVSLMFLWSLKRLESWWRPR